jgi:Ca2+-binding EF-hand superfamily protein
MLPSRISQKFSSFISENKVTIAIGSAIVLAGLYVGYKYSHHYDDELESGHSLLDVVSALQDRTQPLSREDIEGLWKKYDEDHSGFLDLEEIHHLLIHLWESQLEKVKRESREKEQFMRKTLTKAKHPKALIDEICLAALHPNELQLCENEYKKAKNGIASSKAVFKKLDKNGDGQISKEEFLELAPDVIRSIFGLPLETSLAEKVILEVSHHHEQELPHDLQVLVHKTHILDGGEKGSH